MNRCIVVVVFSLFCAASSGLGGERPIVAVFDMEDRGSGLSDEALDNLTNYLVVMMAGGGYQVIPREEIRERLRAQQVESYKLCYDEKCQIELGRELAAQMSLASQIMKIGDRCQVTAVLYDLKRSASTQASSSEASCDEISLLKAIKELSRKLRRAPEEEGAGILLVKTDPPGAEVKVNGDEVGTSPVTVKNLPAGRHVVEARKGGVAAKQTSRVRVYRKGDGSFSICIVLDIRKELPHQVVRCLDVAGTRSNCRAIPTN